MRKGKSYVSHGGSHITDLSLDGIQSFAVNREFTLKAPKTVKITAKAAAYLKPQQEAGASIANRPLDEQPYSNIERVRIGKSGRFP